MYGLLIEAIVYYIKNTYGEETWHEIRKRANLSHMSFSIHERYNENMIQIIALSASDITGRPVNDLMDSFGHCFVNFVGQYGYDRILNVLGRNLRDFLNGLDNLHEYLRFSYQKLRPPSFFCENESKTGLTLHYRSKRRGYMHYVKGQIKQVARTFYKTKVDIDVVSERFDDGMLHIEYKIFFDNTAYKEPSDDANNIISDSLPVSSKVFFDLFPFHIMLNREIEINNVGYGLSSVLQSNMIGRKLVDLFKVIRPISSIEWTNILGHVNNVFELATKEAIKRRGSASTAANSEDGDMEVASLDTNYYFEDDSNHLILKGQMIYISHWDKIVFLGTPVLENLDSMFTSGMYINDLSMHDSSRDLVLAGTQQSSELRLALDQEQQRSKSLEDNMKKLDEEIKRTDQLLYQMIPKPIADRLRKGDSPISTCKMFDAVTILFSDVVNFNKICSTNSPMEVVSLLNAMYTLFDHLSEKHNVYKVETVGDAYMVVCGAPETDPNHSINVCDMAIDMIKSVRDLIDPSTGRALRIRIGVHSGSAVAGVVGLRMPRFCLFGDTVNTASRMQSNGEAQRIHISESTYNDIKFLSFDIKERGLISIKPVVLSNALLTILNKPPKGKGSMKTYWLHGKLGADEPITPPGSILMAEIEGQSEEDKVRFDKNMTEIRNMYTPVPIRKTSTVGYEDSRDASKSNMLVDDEESEHTMNVRQSQSVSRNDPTSADVYNSNIDRPPRRINGKNVRPNSKTCSVM